MGILSQRGKDGAAFFEALPLRDFFNQLDSIIVEYCTLGTLE